MIDTIAALATPPGRGGVGIVRISGPQAPAIAEALLGFSPRPRHAHYTPFSDGEGLVLDEGIALYFPAPHSFTGEQVVELQGHGGPVVMDLLLKAIFALGARPARAGEFSERAFLNDKLDLAQAEAVADLIEAGSAQAARSALRSLQGEFSRRVHALVEGVIEARVYVESSIDFVDEEGVEFLGADELRARLDGVMAELAAVRRAAGQGRLLREGMSVVLAGLPNAGKSSLLNALAGEESAIVTDIPGTTRDILRERIDLDGMPLHIIDTAGLRESDDAVEREGVRRAWAAIEKADRLLLLVDDREGFGEAQRAILEQLPESLPRTLVHNKIDLSGAGPGERDGALYLSAKSGAGLEQLRAHLKRVMGYEGAGEGSFMARRRHLEALERADENLRQAQAWLEQGSGELLAEELRLAQQALGEITGQFHSDELLGRIFTSFCIGK